MSSVPPHLVRVLSSAGSVGFSGSRLAVSHPLVLASALSLVPVSARVFVGCAHGLDSAVRSYFPHSVVYRASSFGSGRGSFARRSIALVSALAAQASPVFVSFPQVSCPAGLLPSSSSSACFCGLGSGSWASLAFAVGCGVPCFLWLPLLVSPPVGWGFVGLGSGWFFLNREH